MFTLPVVYTFTNKMDANVSLTLGRNLHLLLLDFFGNEVFSIRSEFHKRRIEFLVDVDGNVNGGEIELVKFLEINGKSIKEDAYKVWKGGYFIDDDQRLSLIDEMRIRRALMYY